MLKFNITGDKLELVSARPLNSGSKGYYIAEFTFDSDWDGLIPHITIAENGTPRPDEVIIDNTYKIPTTESGVMQIGVYGLDSNGKKCISSNLVCIEVSPGAYTGVEPLPKDIWDGYQRTVLGYTERTEGAATDAKASADKAAKSEANAKKFADSITEMTVDAEGLPESSPPTVKKSQVGDVIHLSFGIPKGEKGIGVKEITINSSNELVITLTDDTVLNLGNVKGPKGDKGEDGQTPVIEQEIKENSKNAVSSNAVYWGLMDLMMYISEDLSIQKLSFNSDYNLERKSDENGEIGVYLTDSEGTILHPFLVNDTIYAGHASSADYAIDADYAWSDQQGRILKGSEVDVYWDDYEYADVELIDGYSHYYGLISNSLICSIGTYDYGFSSALYFATPSEIPEDYSQFPDDIYFKGDSTDEGAFVPEANMRYTIVFDYDGYMLNAYVSGVEMANEEEAVSEEETV